MFGPSILRVKDEPIDREGDPAEHRDRHADAQQHVDVAKDRPVNSIDAEMRDRLDVAEGLRRDSHCRGGAANSDQAPSPVARIVMPGGFRGRWRGLLSSFTGWRLDHVHDYNPAAATLLRLS
jgi:hypothetical protein